MRHPLSSLAVASLLIVIVACTDSQVGWLLAAPAVSTATPVVASDGSLSFDVSGSGFTTATTVTVSGRSCTVDPASLTPTRLTCRLATSPTGQVVIQVSNGGQSARPFQAPPAEPTYIAMRANSDSAFSVVAAPLDECGQAAIVLLDQYARRIALPAAVSLAVAVTASSGGTFPALTGCSGTAVTSYNLPAGQTYTLLDVRLPASGSQVLTPSANGLLPLSLTLQGVRAHWNGGATIASQNGSYSGVLAPGARQLAVGARDGAGNFWMFGGLGNASVGSNTGFLGDLWLFSNASGSWSQSWSPPSAADPSGINQPGGFHALASFDSQNWPGARDGAAVGLDSSNQLWVFGGLGCNGLSCSFNKLNDTWVFDTVARKWKWAAGSSSTANSPGTTSYPAARSEAVAVMDSSDRLWVFGGEGPTGTMMRNDVWKLTTAAPPATFWSLASPGVASSVPVLPTFSGGVTNPGGRKGAAGWIDSSGSLWVFGGTAYASTGTVDVANDLWRFSAGAWSTSDTAISSPPVYGTRGVTDSANRPTPRSGASYWTDPDRTNTFWLFGGYGKDAGDQPGYLNDLWRLDVTTAPVTFQWTWIAGSPYVNQAGVYGDQASFNPADFPGARQLGIVWAGKTSPSKNTELHVFGGVGFGDWNPSDGASPLNDLWTLFY